MSAFSYNHFDGTSGNINSLFPSILGTTYSQSPYGSVYTSHSAIYNINNNLRLILNNA